MRKRLITAGEGGADGEMIEQLKQMREKFETAMNDDLNTSIALSVVFELVRFANKLLEEASVTAGALNAVEVLFDRLGGDCLGIVKDEYPQTTVDELDYLDKFRLFMEMRERARENKEFGLADDIRAYLGTSGFNIMDTPKGSSLEQLTELPKDAKKKAQEYRRKIIDELFKDRYSK